MGSAPAEVEARAYVSGFVFASIIQLIPGGVFREIETRPIDGEVVDPDFAWIIPAFQDRHKAKVGEDGAVGTMLLHQFARSDLIIKFEGDDSTAFICFRIVIKVPFVNLTGRDRLCLDALPAHNFPDHAGFAAPAARAIFEMAMER